MKDQHKIAVTPHPGTEGGVRVRLTLDLSEFTLYALGGADGVNETALDKILARAGNDLRAKVAEAVKAAQG